MDISGKPGLLFVCLFMKGNGGGMDLGKSREVGGGTGRVGGRGNYGGHVIYERRIRGKKEKELLKSSCRGDVIYKKRIKNEFKCLGIYFKRKLFILKRASPCITGLETLVLAIPGRQPDYIWNEVQSRDGGHTCDSGLAGRPRFLT